MFDLTPFDRMTRSFAAYDPFREMEREMAEMEKRFFGTPSPTFRTDIRESDGAYILEADLPGFAKEEIHAEIKENVLTVSAEHKTESEKKDGDRYIRRERSFGSYRRSFDLRGIEVDAITAAYRDGVLTLTLPKKEQKPPEARALNIE